MKATELTIGDWVMAEDGVIGHEKRHPVKLTAVSEVMLIEPKIQPGIITSEWAGVRLPLVQGSKELFTPIPLTSEILRKNGIELMEVGDNATGTPTRYRNRYEKWSIRTQWKDTLLWFDRTTKKYHLADMNAALFEHVHELQHALRLAGIEKEIEL